MAFIMPTEKTRKPRYFWQLRIMFYAPPKFGKSTFGAQFPDSIIIATEPGLGNIEAMAGYTNSWEDCLDAQAKILAPQNTGKFKTVVFDTIDNAYRQCENYICINGKKRTLSDFGYGKGGEAIKMEFRNWMTKWFNSGLGLVFLSHCQEKNCIIPGKPQGEIRLIPNCGKEVYQEIIGTADIILLGQIEVARDPNGVSLGMQRVLNAAPGENYDAGDRTGRLPPKFHCDFNTFASFFRPPAQPQPPPQLAALQNPDDSGDLQIDDANQTKGENE